MPRSAREILENREIKASAPCRIDSGGTWDIKSLALPFEHVKPVTLNIALNLRTWITLSACNKGRVKVVSQGFAASEEYPFQAFRLTSPFNLFFAAVAYFGHHGLQVHIKSDSPPKSGLGGSSTALVALIKALGKLDYLLNEKRWSSREILHLAYHLEDAMGDGKCGMQDQGAAVYGGVNLWTWCYGSTRAPFKRQALLRGPGTKELARHILVAYSGKSHVSQRTNRKWIKEFLDGRTRKGWIRVNDLCKEFADALRIMDWEAAARIMRMEMAIRRQITPDSLTPITRRLISQAEEMGCGARFAGAGAGGAVWALGPMENITDLRNTWDRTLATIKGGKVLDCSIDSRGAY
ncbi:MAG: galactokinase [Deltaproteobacteria bacterium]|nr:galactokinase [Deltaproteobacteria bacterium]